MPFHHYRTWRVERGLGPSQIAHRISNNTFCGCVGFECQGLLWLNDSTGPDGAQEWAVIRESDSRQCESITTGWSTPEKDAKNVLETQAKFVEGAKPMFGEGNALRESALDHGDGDCPLCA